MFRVAKTCVKLDHTLDPVVAPALDRAVLETTRALAHAVVLAAAKKNSRQLTVCVTVRIIEGNH